MSNYLTFYITRKNTDESPLEIMSVSRNSELYQALNEYIYQNQESELTKEIVNWAISDVRNDIDKLKNKIDEYYNHLPDKLSDRMEMLDSILSLKEDMCDSEKTMHNLMFINDIVEQSLKNATKVIVEIS